MARLSIDEVLVRYLDLAITSIHELAHALCNASHGPSALFFFEDDSFCKLGLALENFVFGGRLCPSHQDDAAKHKPLLLTAILFRAMCQWYPEHYGDDAMPMLAGPPLYDDHWWMTMDYVERLFDNDCWDVEIPRTGGKALRPKQDFAHCWQSLDDECWWKQDRRRAT